MTEYRTKPENTPLLPDGSPLAGGPWVLAGAGSADKAYHTEDNNSVLAVCTARNPHDAASDYVVHIAPFSEANSRIVGAARFSHGLGVPYSNGETPRTDDVAQFKQHCYDMRGIQDGRGDRGYIVNLMDVTDVTFTREGDEAAHKVEQVMDGKKIGTCNISPTGVFAYVDTNGHTHISGKNAQHWLEIFTQNGIPRNSELEVPFAQGEVPPPQNPNAMRDITAEKIREFQAKPEYQRQLAILKKQEAETRAAEVASEPVATTATVQAEEEAPALSQAEAPKTGWMNRRGNRRDFLTSLAGQEPAGSSAEIAQARNGAGWTTEL